MCFSISLSVNLVNLSWNGIRCAFGILFTFGTSVCGMGYASDLSVGSTLIFCSDASPLVDKVLAVTLPVEGVVPVGLAVVPVSLASTMGKCTLLPASALTFGFFLGGNVVPVSSDLTRGNCALLPAAALAFGSMLDNSVVPVSLVSDCNSWPNTTLGMGKCTLLPASALTFGFIFGGSVVPVSSASAWGNCALLPTAALA